MGKDKILDDALEVYNSNRRDYKKRLNEFSNQLDRYEHELDDIIFDFRNFGLNLDESELKNIVIEDERVIDSLKEDKELLELLKDGKKLSNMIRKVSGVKRPYNDSSN